MSGVGLLWLQVDKRLLKPDRSHSLGGPSPQASTRSLRAPVLTTSKRVSSLKSTLKVPGKDSARLGLGSMSTLDSSL